jgi:hypothetical protein
MAASEENVRSLVVTEARTEKSLSESECAKGSESLGHHQLDQWNIIVGSMLISRWASSSALLFVLLASTIVRTLSFGWIVGLLALVGV